MTINHVVCIKYKDSCTNEEKSFLASELIALAQTCLINGKKYILSVTGGKNNSVEAYSKGFEHSFVMVFANLSDRDYYVDKDPSHGAFKLLLGPKIADILVIDFESGVFNSVGKL